jgi:hypothetical protein
MSTLVKKTIKVGLTTEHGSNDQKFLNMTTSPKLAKARPIIQKVEHHYIGGRVRTSSGDVWLVQANPNQNESTYIAVRG